MEAPELTRADPKDDWYGFAGEEPVRKGRPKLTYEVLKRLVPGTVTKEELGVILGKKPFTAYQIAKIHKFELKRSYTHHTQNGYARDKYRPIIEAGIKANKKLREIGQDMAVLNNGVPVTRERARQVIQDLGLERKRDCSFKHWCEKNGLTEEVLASVLYLSSSRAEAARLLYSMGFRVLSHHLAQVTMLTSVDLNRHLFNTRQMQHCFTCRNLLPKESYQKHFGTAFGYACRCKSCVYIDHSARSRSKNPNYVPYGHGVQYRKGHPNFKPHFQPNSWANRISKAIPNMPEVFDKYHVKAWIDANLEPRTITVESFGSRFWIYAKRNLEVVEKRGGYGNTYRRNPHPAPVPVLGTEQGTEQSHLPTI